MSLKKSSRQSSDGFAESLQDAARTQRREEFERAALLPPPRSPAEGLEALWDLLALLDALAGPRLADRSITYVRPGVL